MNIFEQATREKLRFPSSKGVLQVEDLWDVPLLSRDNFNLNQIAKTVNATLKDAGQENFVPSATKPTAEDKRAALRLEIVKYVIGVKVEEQETARAKADKAAKREKLVELLGKRQDEELEKLTPEEIRAKLAELED